jgi:hypothetical protein
VCGSGACGPAHLCAGAEDLGCCTPAPRGCGSGVRASATVAEWWSRACWVPRSWAPAAGGRRVGRPGEGDAASDASGGSIGAEFSQRGCPSGAAVLAVLLEHRAMRAQQGFMLRAKDGDGAGRTNGSSIRPKKRSNRGPFVTRKKL